MRGNLFEFLTAVFILQTTITEVHTYSTQSGDDGLEAADIAAIVLGVLLLVLIIVAVVVCILVKKGKICVKEDTPKVTPTRFLNGFSTTPGRLRDCSFRAITREKSKKRATPREDKHSPRTDTDSTIIYMYDDVYHSPDSRPLPGNKVKAEPYPTHDPERSSRKNTTPKYNVSRSSRGHRHENEFRETRISRRSSRHSAPTPPPTPEAEVKIPDSGRISITSSDALIFYKSKMLWSNKECREISDDKCSDWPRSKAFADDKLNVSQMMRFVFEKRRKRDFADGMVKNQTAQNVPSDLGLIPFVWSGCAVRQGRYILQDGVFMILEFIGTGFILLSPLIIVPVMAIWKAASGLGRLVYYAN